MSAFRVAFSSPQCSGSTDLTPETCAKFEVDTPIHTLFAPEAGGEVQFTDKDGLNRIKILSAALHQELTQAGLEHGDTEFNAAMTHLQQVYQWTALAFRKNRLEGFTPPPAPTPFPPKVQKQAPRRLR